MSVWPMWTIRIKNQERSLLSCVQHEDEGMERVRKDFD